MSFKHVEAALQAAIPKTDGIDTGVVKSVLVAICQHAHQQTGQCFPSVGRLARMTQHSVSSVSRSVDVLHKMGVFSMYRKGDGHICSLYCIDLKKLQSWQINWKDKGSSQESSGAGASKVVGTQTSHEEPRVPTGNSDFPAGMQGSPWAPNQELNGSENLSFDLECEQGSLRSLPPSAVHANLNQKTDQEPEQVKTSRASGVLANQDQKKPQNQSSFRVAKPYKAPKPCMECLGEDGIHHKSCTRHPENVMAAAATQGSLVGKVPEL